MAARLTTLVVAGIVAATLIAGFIVGAQRDDSDGPVDLIVHNGRVFTGAGKTLAEAVAIRGNQILRAGAERDIMRLARPQTEIVDAGGAAVLPGFNDTNVEFLEGSAAFDGVDLRDAATLEELENRVRSWAEANPDRPWIVGRGWRHDVLIDPLATRQRLDRVVPDRPARLLDEDGRTAWVNTRALELAHLPAAGAAPALPGRRGDATGLLRGDEAALVAGVLPKPSDEDRARALRAAIADAHRVGITSVQDVVDSAEDLDRYAATRRAGDLDLRVYAALAVAGEPDDAGLTALGRLLDRYPDDPLFKAGAVAVTVDEDEPGGRAMLTDEVDADTVPYTADQLNRLVRRLDARGWQVIARAAGDRAVRMSLDAFAHARRSNPNRDGERRPRIDGATFIAPADLPRFEGLGVIASLRPMRGPAPDPGAVAVSLPRIGATMAAFPAADLVAKDGRIAFGSGWPAGPLEPLAIMEAAVERGRPADAVEASGRDRSDAIAGVIEGYTSAGAWASFDEQRKGVLAAGMLADIVVLSEDIFGDPGADLASAHVAVTIFDGRIVYRRPGTAARPPE